MKSNTVLKNETIQFSLFLFLLSLLIFSSCKQSPEQLFEQHYTNTVPNTKEVISEYARLIISSRGDNSKDTATVVFQGERIAKFEFDILEKARVDTLVQGLKMFDNSKWDDAQTQLTKYIKRYNQPLDDYKLASFYLAKSSLNNQDYANALKYYDEFTNTAGDNHELMDMASWDNAICYLMVDPDKAKTLFENIAGDNGSSYSDEAKAMISYL